MFYLRIIIQVILVLIIGFIIGYERAKDGKVIGIRTTTLVLLGAYAFALMAPLLNIMEGPRIVTGIAGAVGFIGSGIIWKGEDKIVNLTTSVLILVLAAIGCLLALNFELVAIILTIVTWIVLKLYPKNILEDNASL